jgi:hypothetical protein
MESMDARIEENSGSIDKTRKEVEKVDRELRRMEKRIDDIQERMEDTLFEELRERDQRKLNLILHGVEEPTDNIEDLRERQEADKDTCGIIFKAIRARATRSSLKFCRRIGKRGRDPRAMVIGLYSEHDRRNLLERSRDLQHTRYKDVNIVPDLTKKQRAEEVKMKEEAERRNRDLTTEDREKNMKWLVVGKKGEKRIMKGQEREIISRIGRTGDGDRLRGAASNGDWEGGRRRSGEKDQGREKRETGARRKEGGVWNRERRNNEQRRNREKEDESCWKDTRGGVREDSQEWAGRWRAREERDRYGRRVEEDGSHRYSDWRENNRQEAAVHGRVVRDREQKGRESMEKSVVELGRGRVNSKRGRESDSGSDREGNWPRNKTTRQ